MTIGRIIDFFVKIYRGIDKIFVVLILNFIILPFIEIGMVERQSFFEKSVHEDRFQILQTLLKICYR